MGTSSTFPSYGHRRWQAPVATSANLPASGNIAGDVRLVVDTLTLKAWNGSSWVDLAGGGGSSNSFTTIQTITGTFPVATSPTDTLTFESDNSSLDIIGNATTDTINIKVKSDFVRGLISASAPLSYDNTTGVISIQVANGSQNGYLSSTDWSTFNNKVSSSRAINTGSGLTGGGDLSADRTISIDLNGLTEDTTPDVNDFIMTYDVSASALKKVKLSNLPGGGGGGTSGSAIYGDGVDGNVTISVNTVLSGLSCYNTLELSGNCSITARYPVVCKELINVSGNNIIQNSGLASTGTSGAGGGVGSYSGIGSGGSGANGVNTGTPATSTASTNSLGGKGGDGGAGDNAGTPTNGGLAGNCTAPGATSGGKNAARLSAQTYRLVLPTSATACTVYTGGTGGGGGGIRGTGQTSRGAGGGGGICWVKARTVTITSGTLAFESKGGNGQDGFSTGTSYEGGSGAGGGGAVVAISTTDLSTLSGFSTDVSGGIGGLAAGGAATNGADGSPGTVILIRDGE